MLQGETMSIMFVDGAEAPSTNIMDMVSAYAPGKKHRKENDLNDPPPVIICYRAKPCPYNVCGWR